MDPATILVLVMGAGVAALLIWFEINSRRNDASKTPESTLAPSALETLTKKGQTSVEPKRENRKAA